MGRCEKKTRVGGIRTLLVGLRPRWREEVKCPWQNLLLNFQPGAVLGRVKGGKERAYNCTGLVQKQKMFKHALELWFVAVLAVPLF